MRTKRFYAAAGLTIGALALAGCGGSEAPAVCASLVDLQSDLETLRAVDLGASQEAVTNVENALTPIRTDLAAVKSDAEAELQEPVAAFETAVNDLSTAFDTAKADGELSAAEAQTMGALLTDVSSTWEALKEAVPDCELEA